MGTLFFIARCFVVTVVVILFMQIKIGETTIEYKINDMVRSSGIQQPAQHLADGIVRFVRNSWRKLTNGFDTNVSRTLNTKNSPGSRFPEIDFNRSAEYIREQTAKAKNKVEGHLRDEGIVVDGTQDD